MARYGAMAAWARTMGLDDAVELLEQTLEEEKASDQRLNEIAERASNKQAAESGEEDEEFRRRGRGRERRERGQRGGAGPVASPGRSLAHRGPGAQQGGRKARGPRRGGQEACDTARRLAQIVPPSSVSSSPAQAGGGGAERPVWQPGTRRAR